MNLTKYIDTDLLLVIAASSLVCVACSCLLIRAYRGKNRSRRKEKELQRPFIKRKRHSSPTTSPLFGNLQLYKGSPNQQQYIVAKKLSSIKVARKAPCPGNFIDTSNLLENNTLQCHFLGDAIASINQQQWQVLPAARMLSSKKKVSRKMRQLRGTFACHAGSLDSEREDMLNEGDAQISVGINKRDNDSNMQRTNGPSEMMVLDHTGSPSSYGSSQQKLMQSSKCNASRRAGQMSTDEVIPKEESRLFRVRWHQPRTPLKSNTSAVSDPEISIERPNSLWAHNCSCKGSFKTMAAKLGHTFHRIPVSFTKETLGNSSHKQVHGKDPFHCNNGSKSEGSIQLETVTMAATSKDDTPNGCIDNDVNCVAKDVHQTSKDVSKGCLDVSKECLDVSQHLEYTRTSGSVAKPVVCPHEVSNNASVVSSASKNEVSCMLCGMTLSKPQCFYSLGSLCTDEEICETGSDDINRHPVGDINVSIVSPLMDIQTHNNDTGYTSTDEFENDPASDCFYEKADTGSYDGDYESDNEETFHKSVVVSDEQAVKPLVSIGEPITITEYALREWKSNTLTSVAMRKGYAAISSFVNCHHLRQIRGDNYCSIRAVLFQALVGGLPILNRFEIEKERKIIQIPAKLFTLRDTTLEQWRFANRFPVPQTEVKTTLENFLTFFNDQIHMVLECGSDVERLESTLSLFSEDTQEFKVLEATKLLMYDTAVELFGRFTRGEDVPVFAMLLFARDSSNLPCRFLTNHLNKTGDSGGLEQVEMCLLGYTLGLVIQVVRPSQVDKDDFIAYYPSLDDVPKYTPTVTLVAEDDRHYNIIL